MKKIFTLVILFSGIHLIVNAQSDTMHHPMHNPQQSSPMQYNAGFDVIIKLNGEIIYGLVKEIDPFYVKYKRTDIPDGPIYYLAKSEVYAISYRNQVKDILNPRFIQPVLPYDPLVTDTFSLDNLLINYKVPMFKNGTAFIGLGFIRGFTKVKDVGKYSSKATFPTVLFGYDADYKNNVRLGLQMGFGSHKFSLDEFSSYDSTINNIDLKENVFALYAYARYNLATKSIRFQPYIIGGLGITSSSIKSENLIKFTNNNSQEIIVKSGGRSAGIGIIARIGTQYLINNQVRAFLDAGVGLSVLNLGIAINTH